MACAFVPELALVALAAALAALAPPGAPVGAGRDASLRGLIGRPLVWRYGAMTSFSFGASFAVGAWIVPLFTQTRVLGRGGCRRGLADPVRGHPHPAARGALAPPAGAGLADHGGLGRGWRRGGARARARPRSRRIHGRGPGRGPGGGLPYGATTAGVMAAFPGEPGEAVAVTIAMSVYFGVAVVFLLGLAFGAGEGPLGFAILAAVLALAPAAPRRRPAVG